MLARKLTLEESEMYDAITDERFAQIRQVPERLDFSNMDTAFHTNKAEYDETTHVKIRLLYRHKFPVNFSNR